MSSVTSASFTRRSRASTPISTSSPTRGTSIQLYPSPMFLAQTVATPTSRSSLSPPTAVPTSWPRTDQRSMYPPPRLRRPSNSLIGCCKLTLVGATVDEYKEAYYPLAAQVRLQVQVKLRSVRYVQSIYHDEKFTYIKTNAHREVQRLRDEATASRTSSTTTCAMGRTSSRR
jgi:hypothetical protein